jgi:hypothetical protein
MDLDETRTPAPFEAVPCAVSYSETPQKATEPLVCLTPKE